jgi:hypothetical protein
MACRIASASQDILSAMGADDTQIELPFAQQSKRRRAEVGFAAENRRRKTSLNKPRVSVHEKSAVNLRDF